MTVTPQNSLHQCGNTVIDISITCEAWSEALPDAESLCREAIQKTLHTYSTQRGKLQSSVEISLVLSDDTFIQNLNKQYRNIDRPTNVLAFPGDDVTRISDNIDAADGAAPLLLGDVVVAYETAAAEALEQHKTLTDHLRHLVVHGTLHLFGYDHEAESDAIEMETLEIEILSALGVTNPYKET